MGVRVKAGSENPKASAGGAPPQTYQGTTSGYGATRGDSVGVRPITPKIHAQQLAQTYKNQSVTAFKKKDDE